MIGKEICRHIRELRISMKLSQNQFAELVDLSVDSIGKIERGVNVPSVETLYKVSQALKIPMEALLPSHANKRLSKQSKAIAGLIGYLETRPPEDIEFVHKLVVTVLERK